jgi:hypothetical protein
MAGMMTYTQMIRRTLTETTDGAGNRYILPDFMKLFDCAGCLCAVSRRPELAEHSPRPVSRLCGHLFDVNAHARPYCIDCYMRLRGFNLASIGITDG